MRQRGSLAVQTREKKKKEKDSETQAVPLERKKAKNPNKPSIDEHTPNFCWLTSRESKPILNHVVSMQSQIRHRSSWINTSAFYNKLCATLFEPWARS